MRQVMFAMAVVPTVAVATADEPAAAQPAVRPAVQPAAPIRPPQVTAARMAQLEEEFETAEAARDVKRAHVKVAELNVRVAEIEFERVTRLWNNRVVSKEEADKAKLEVEVAKAQVAIREAELKEVEVKVKYAKKRLDDAKAVGVRPVPMPVRPPVDPQSN